MSAWAAMRSCYDPERTTCQTACGSDTVTWGHRDGDAVGIFGRDGPEFDYSFGAVQAGLDLYRREYENGQRDNAGLYVAFGRAHADVEHNLPGFQFKGGEDDFDAVSVGGYWTRFGENNWYLDGVLQEPGTTWT